MKKRELLRKAAGVVLTVVMAAQLVACGDKKDEETKATAENAATSEVAVPEAAFDVVVISADKLTKIGDYKSYTYEAFNSEVSDEEVDEYYKNMVDQYIEAGYKGHEKDEERMGTAVADGDVVNIDYTGYMDGVAFDNGAGTDYNLTIGSGKFIPGFEDSLIGKTIGETVTIDVTFPEEYPNDPEKAGKPAQFEVKLNYVLKEVDITQDNAFKVYFNFETYDELKADLKSYLESSKDEASYIEEKKNEYINNLIESSEFADISAEAAENAAILKGMYEEAAESSGADLATFISYYGFASEDDFNTYINNSSQNQLKFELLMEEIAKAEGIELTEEKYSELVAKQAESAGQTDAAAYEAEYDSHFGKGGFRRSITSYYIEDELFVKYAKAE